MPGVAVVNSGNYDLQIATGFQVDAFVLDDALKGVLDNTDLRAGRHDRVCRCHGLGNKRDGAARSP
jgi:hypothetical protein